MNATIRQAKAEDLPIVCELFYNTINSVNIKDYDASQVEAWSGSHNNVALWHERLTNQYFIVAEINDEMVGFSSLTPEGYLDLMFVHQNYQGHGIATLLLVEIEAHAKNIQQNKILTTHASITAKPFFQRKGFTIAKQQIVNVKGVDLTNFVMHKELR